MNIKQFYLFIDTVSPENKIIIFDKEKIISLYKYKSNQNQASYILPKIEEMLKKNNISLKDIQSIGCINGPGNFTSLRIGIIIVNTLSYLLKIKTFSIDFLSFYKQIFFSFYKDKNKILFYFKIGSLKDILYGNLYKDKAILNYKEYLNKKIDISKIQSPILTSKYYELKLNKASYIEYIKLSNLYKSIIKNINYKKQIEPFYLKKPNITKRKKL